MQGRSEREAREPDPEPDGVTSLPLATPLEDLAAPAWLIDRKGAIIGANRSARQLEVAEGRTLPLSTPSSRHLLAEGSELLRACEEGRPLEVCVRGVRESCPRRLVLEPLRDHNGTPAGALLLVTETGNPRRARSFYARILAAASLELQSPLSGLRNFHTLARRATVERDTERAGLYLERLERHAERLDYLVGELRDLVEILSGSSPLVPAPVDLSAEVRTAVDAVAGTAREHLFEISAPADAVAIADRDRIRRVLAALLSNAIRFSPGGGRIHIEVQLSAREVTLAVSDNGPGVPESRLGDLFDGPCWDREAASGGLGLGLYLAREAVEMHGGCIRAEPGAERGTRVVVTLPRLKR